MVNFIFAFINFLGSGHALLWAILMTDGFWTVYFAIFFVINLMFTVYNLNKAMNEYAHRS